MGSYYLRDWTNHTGDVELFEFHINTRDGNEIAKALRAAGLPNTATQLRKNFDFLGVFMLNGLAVGAQQSIYRCIPWDSEELGQPSEYGGHVKIDLADDDKPFSKVFIDGEDHYGAKRKNPEEASTLAIFLNKPVGPNNDLHRTQQPRGGSTEDRTNNWIIDAQIDFQGRKQQILKGLI